MIATKLSRWLSQKKLPQRLLLSGGCDLWPSALETATKLTGESLETIRAGIQSDVKLCPDDGNTLRIGEQQNPDPHSVRGLIDWLNKTPVASHRVLVLENLERTSRDAMQAWLKILEEPPPRAQFILTSKNHHLLPTTVLSRVTVLPISESLEDQDMSSDVDTFLSTQDLITKFQQIETLDKAEKETPKICRRFAEDLLQYARKQPRYTHHLPILFSAYQDLNRNVNRRLVLENLAIALQKS